MMDTKKYFEEVFNKLDSMSDEEFDKLLLEAGIEDCPFDEVTYTEVSLEEISMVAGKYEQKDTTTQQISPITLVMTLVDAKEVANFVLHPRVDSPYLRGSYENNNLYKVNDLTVINTSGLEVA